MKTKTRFAPSPTGSLHIGGLRTALYSYGLAKQGNGVFVLRIEDTDKKREVPGSKEKIQKLLKMFGLDWDEMHVQSERVKKGIYREAAEKLVDSGHAFYCQCQARNAKKKLKPILRDPCRDKNLSQGAIKLKIPDKGNISFTDFVLQKKVSWETKAVADTTILKSDGFPTYHLAVVVDDFLMNITHALRGHDWMPSTPIHLLIYKYLGYKLPEIGHLTDILDPEGGKLSKRKESSTVKALLKRGFLPEAILNFVMLLGWAPKDDREMFSLEEFVKAFTPNGLQKANPVFNIKKLNWFNGEYIRKYSNDKLVEITLGFYGERYEKELVEKIIPLVKERINSLSEFKSIAGFFFKRNSVDKGYLEKGWRGHLAGAREVLEGVDNWNVDKIGKTLLNLIDEKNFKTGQFFMNLRVAITGSRVTPPINESLVILGREETLERLKAVLMKK